MAGKTTTTLTTPPVERPLDFDELGRDMDVAARTIEDAYVATDHETCFTVIGANIEAGHFVELLSEPEDPSDIRHAPMDGTRLWRTKVFYPTARDALVLYLHCRPWELGTPIRWVIASVVGEWPYQASAIEIVPGSRDVDQIRAVASKHGLAVDAIWDL